MGRAPFGAKLEQPKGHSVATRGVRPDFRPARGVKPRMDRYAIFVDAEYLYTEGGMLCCNSPARQEILLYGLGANDFLVGLATDVCDLQPLRTYWYDTSKDGVPTSAQQLVATLPNMKLRLQRSGPPGQQTPLGAAIRRDLTTLARQRAICDAFLLSADEDLIESVREVQDLGLRVTLINIASRDERGDPTASFANEADEVIKLTKDDLSRFIRRRRAPDDAASDTYDPVDSVAAAATEFAESWLYRASDDEFDALLDQRPRIPESLDGDLLYAVENVIGGSLRGQDRLRRAVRQAFWNRIDNEVQDWPPDSER